MSGRLPILLRAARALDSQMSQVGKYLQRYPRLHRSESRRGPLTLGRFAPSTSPRTRGEVKSAAGRREERHRAETIADYSRNAPRKNQRKAKIAALAHAAMAAIIKKK